MAARPHKHHIGPFEYGEAAEYIQKFSLALTNLGLQKRFTIDGTPRPVTGNENGRSTHYQVILTDNQPDEPKPTWLTTVDIQQAEAKGYTKQKTRYYEAFGQRMTMGKWAEAVGVSRPTLESRIKAGMTMEEALTQIALKKAS